MKYLLSILGVLSTFLSFSQSLTPQEVVAYLNKIAHENPPTDNYVHTFTLNGGNLKVDYGEVKKVKGKDTIVYIDNLSKEIDLNAYKISRAKVEGSIVCQELMKVEIDKSYYNRVSQVLPVNVDEYLNKVPVYLLYDCNSSSVLDIFEDGIKYLTTLLKREGGSPKVIPNPFRVLSADNSDINIKMSNINGNWFFNSSIAGENVRFIFDSGASECTLSQSVFSKLFATDSTLFSKVEDGLFRMADGNIKRLPRYVLKKMTINSSNINNIVFTVTPEGSPNLFGNSALLSFSSWIINQKTSTLLLKRQ